MLKRNLLMFIQTATARTANLGLAKKENRLSVYVILDIFLTVSPKAHACFDRPDY